MGWKLENATFEETELICEYGEPGEEAAEVAVEDLVARPSAVMTLLPGDLISTGTPAGVGPLVPGDRVEVRIEGIGSLKNPVIKL